MDNEFKFYSHEIEGLMNLLYNIGLDDDEVREIPYSCGAWYQQWYYEQIRK